MVVTELQENRYSYAKKVRLIFHKIGIKFHIHVIESQIKRIMVVFGLDTDFVIPYWHLYIFKYKFLYFWWFPRQTQPKASKISTFIFFIQFLL